MLAAQIRFPLNPRQTASVGKVAGQLNKKEEQQQCSAFQLGRDHQERRRRRYSVVGGGVVVVAAVVAGDEAAQGVASAAASGPVVDSKTSEIAATEAAGYEKLGGRHRFNSRGECFGLFVSRVSSSVTPGIALFQREWRRTATGRRCRPWSSARVTCGIRSSRASSGTWSGGSISCWWRNQSQGS